jgi:hypothetical protein
VLTGQEIAGAHRTVVPTEYQVAAGHADQIADGLNHQQRPVPRESFGPGSAKADIGKRQRRPDPLAEHLQHQLRDRISWSFALPPRPDPAGIRVDLPVPALSGALSYGCGEACVV